MKLRNPFLSLTWNSLWLRSRARLRRVRRSLAPVSLAAEILEVRSLLSGNVVAATAGTALTLTSDSGDNDVNVFRLNATTVEIDGLNGTTINGAASRTFALSSVSGITVNLGSGFDSYDIFSASGKPALNIGAGGILFRGPSGGSSGDDLRVFNDSSSAMTIGGNVTVQGSLPLSPLVHHGSSDSSFSLFTENHGNLTVSGSVFASQSDADSGNQFNDIFTNSFGNNVTISGSVTELARSAATVNNRVFTQGAGNMVISGSVTQTATSAGLLNEVGAFSTGSVTIGLGVTQTATSSTSTAENRVQDRGSGSISIGMGLMQMATSSTSIAENEVFDFGSGNITTGMGLTQTATSSTSTAENQIIDFFSGHIGIGLGLTQGTSSASSAENDVETRSSGNVTIGPGGVTILASGSGSDDNEIIAEPGGSITIAGSVVVTDTTTGSGNQFLEIDGDTSIGGALLVTMNGPHATIHINDVEGFGTVEVKGLFSATMLGTSPVIIVGDDINGSGASPVRFDSGVTLLGALAAGATFEYDPANVSTPFIIPTFFAIIVS
jgi:hypothetical protein